MASGPTDFMISESDAAVRTTPDRSPAPSRCLCPLRGHGVGRGAPGAGCRIPRGEPPPHAAGVDPRSRRRARLRGAHGRGHPRGPPPTTWRRARLETLAPGAGRPPCSHPPPQTTAMSHPPLSTAGDTLLPVPTLIKTKRARGAASPAVLHKLEGAGCHDERSPPLRGLFLTGPHPTTPRSVRQLVENCSPRLRSPQLHPRGRTESLTR